jgi:hypothetical protein
VKNRRTVTTRPAAVVAALAFALVAAASLAFGAVEGTLDAFTILLTLWVLVGALIIAVQPGNAVGWLFGLAGVLWVTGLTTSAAVDAFGGRALAVDAFGGRALTLVSWYGEWFWIAGFVLMVCSLFLIPTGRTASPGWRRALWAFAALGAGAVALAAVQTTVQTSEGAPTVDNPLGVADVGDVAEKFVPFLVLVGAVAAIASMVGRYRRGGLDERARLKLVVLSAAVAVSLAFIAAVFDGTPFGSVCWIAAFAAIPLGCAIAILRHQLFDVDRVISRTLVYGALTLLLGAAYVGLVLAGQALFSSFAGGSNLAIAASTLVVAALFLPVRARVQHFVDRRFYRRRYDAQRTLEGFGARLREQVELETLSTDLALVVHETIQPSHVSLWLRSGR